MSASADPRQHLTEKYRACAILVTAAGPGKWCVEWSPRRGAETVKSIGQWPGVEEAAAFARVEIDHDYAMQARVFLAEALGESKSSQEWRGD